MFWKEYKPSDSWHKSSLNHLGFEGNFSLQTRFAAFTHHSASLPVLPEEPSSNDITAVTHTL